MPISDLASHLVGLLSGSGSRTLPPYPNTETTPGDLRAAYQAYASDPTAAPTKYGSSAGDMADIFHTLARFSPEQNNELYTAIHGGSGVAPAGLPVDSSFDRSFAANYNTNNRPKLVPASLVRSIVPDRFASLRSNFHPLDQKHAAYYSPRHELGLSGVGMDFDRLSKVNSHLGAAVHENMHALQDDSTPFSPGKFDRMKSLYPEAAFGAAELAPSLMSGLVNYEVARQGGDVSSNHSRGPVASFPSGYQPTHGWMANQARKYGVFGSSDTAASQGYTGKGPVSLEHLLAKNPKWVEGLVGPGDLTELPASEHRKYDLSPLDSLIELLVGQPEAGSVKNANSVAKFANQLNPSGR